MQGDEQAGRAAGRRVRRLPGGRRRVVYVRVSDDELARLRARAAAAGVSVQLLLLEGALQDPVRAVERRAVHALFLEVRRNLIGLATNVNQLARTGNVDGRLPVGTADAMAAIAAMADTVQDAIERVAARVGPVR